MRNVRKKFVKWQLLHNKVHLKSIRYQLTGMKLRENEANSVLALDMTSSTEFSIRSHVEIPECDWYLTDKDVIIASL